MYQVLARKWRPKNFHQLVGQSHVAQALTYALDHNRIHHAYLFTGTRGVGKTTIARIFAKSLNCITRNISSDPCGECQHCTEIDQGHFPDLIEVDAASRTGVDDTRELLDNVPYAPVKGRFKVYLIDEVHMFSKSSFNALLKTLEEPPEHVKFILATTDPQKLPATILSRCLQFHLKNMTEGQIAGHLAQILNKEQAPFEDEALHLLANAAAGSMRDSLSLLDQALAYGQGKITVDDVSTLLGAVSSQQLLHLLEAMISGNGQNLRHILLQLDQYAPDYAALLQNLLQLFQKITIIQLDAVIPEDNISPSLRLIAEQLPVELVQLWYQIATEAWQNLPYQPDSRLALEMTLLRMMALQPAHPLLQENQITSVPKPTVKQEENEDLETTSILETPDYSGSGGADSPLKKQMAEVQNENSVAESVPHSINDLENQDADSFPKMDVAEVQSENPADQFIPHSPNDLENQDADSFPKMDVAEVQSENSAAESIPHSPNDLENQNADSFPKMGVAEVQNKNLADQSIPHSPNDFEKQDADSFPKMGVAEVQNKNSAAESVSNPNWEEEIPPWLPLPEPHQVEEKMALKDQAAEKQNEHSVVKSFSSNHQVEDFSVKNQEQINEKVHLSAESVSSSSDRLKSEAVNLSPKMREAETYDEKIASLQSFLGNVENWSDGLRKMNFNQQVLGLLENCLPDQWENSILSLQYNEDAELFNVEHTRKAAEQSLGCWLGAPCQLKFTFCETIQTPQIFRTEQNRLRQQQAEMNFLSHPHVKVAQAIFENKIFIDEINPLKEE